MFLQTAEDSQDSVQPIRANSQEDEDRFVQHDDPCVTAGMFKHNM